eukprot:scaffold23194_cov54-Attheya_sp.AAC.5
MPGRAIGRGQALDVQLPSCHHKRFGSDLAGLAPGALRGTNILINTRWYKLGPSFVCSRQGDAKGGRICDDVCTCRDVQISLHSQKWEVQVQIMKVDKHLERPLYV